MKRKAPLMFGRIVDDPKYKNLRRIKNGKLGQKVLRDIGNGMSPEAFSRPLWEMIFTRLLWQSKVRIPGLRSRI